jgi:hypothetical protein
MYTKLFFTGIVALLLVGFILPYLFSSATNELPFLGGLIIITIAYFLGKFLTKLHNKEKE